MASTGTAEAKTVQTTETKSRVSADSAPAVIRRRRVLFVSGFDPRGPRHYHELFKTEAPKAAAVAEAATSYALGPRKSKGPLAVEWSIAGETQVNGAPVRTETRFDFLRWDDVARRLWPRADWSFVRDTAVTLWRGIRIGYFRRIYRVRRWYLLTIMQPVATVLLLMLMLMLVPAALAAGGLALAGLSPWFGLLAAPPGLFFFPRALALVEKGSSVLWRGQLNNIYAWQLYFEAPVLDQRIDALAEAIAAAAREGEADEFLVIGHSVGTTVAISALARALMRHPDAFAGIPGLGFATLGAMTPLLAVGPRGEWFQDEIQHLALHPDLTWIDIGAPLDAACFAKVDPFAITGRQRPPGAPVKPVMVSPAFQKLFDAAAYDALRRDRMRMHTQYLLATPRPGRCDFFGLVAGPVPLARRFSAERNRAGVA